MHCILLFVLQHHGWLSIPIAKCYRKWVCKLSINSFICSSMGSRCILLLFVDTNIKSATNLLQNYQVCGLGYQSQVVGYQTAAEMIFPKVSGTCMKYWHIVLVAFWQIKSIERIIATLEQTIAEGAGQGDEGIRMEIAMLRNERAQLCAGFLGDTWPASQFHGIWQPHLNSTPNFFSSTHY